MNEESARARGSLAWLRVVVRFLRIEAASGIVLLSAAVLALAWASSPWAASYHALWHARLEFHAAGFGVERTLEWFVNDALMVVFSSWSAWSCAPPPPS